MKTHSRRGTIPAKHVLHGPGTGGFAEPPAPLAQTEGGIQPDCDAEVFLFCISF